MRYVFNSGLDISEEVTRFIFVWLTFLGSIVALKDGVHLGVDTLVRRLPKPARLLCYWLSHALMLWCCWLIWKGSWELTKNNLHNVAAISGLPVAAMYVSGLVAAALMALILIGNLWRSLRGDLREEAVSADIEYTRLPRTENAREREMTVWVFIGSLLGAMSLGMPIAFALLVCGIALMLQMGTFDAQILAQKVIDGADSYPLMTIPFFLLAGELMNAGGLSRRIVAAAMALFGHLRGGLGYVVIGTGVLLASISGSAIADTATLAVMLLPLMRQAGYSLTRSSGLIAATGIIAPIIPPSVGFILFGVTANLSIGKLFLAGIVPGLLMAVSLVAAWWWLARSDSSPLPPKQSRAETRLALVNAIWAFGLPVFMVVRPQVRHLHAY